MSDIDAVLEALNARVEAPQNDEDLAMALTQRAAVYTAQGNLPRAEHDLKYASDAWFRLNKPAEHGRTEFARARLIAQADPRLAADFFRRAAALSRTGGDAQYEVKSREGIAAVLGSVEDYEGALAETQSLAMRLQELGDLKALAQNLRSQATLLQVLGRPNKALRAFDEAVSIAQAAGFDALALETRIDRRGQVSFTVHPDREPLDALVAEAERLELPTLESRARLQLASEQMRDGDVEGAAKTAEEARQAALEKVQPVVYLMACITLAEIREKQGDLPGVLQILLTCKKTLEQHLGPAAGRGLVHLLDAAEARWGPETTQAALQEYRRRVSR